MKVTKLLLAFAILATGMLKCVDAAAEECDDTPCCSDCICCGPRTKWTGEKCVPDSADVAEDPCDEYEGEEKCVVPECVEQGCCGEGTVFSLGPTRTSSDACRCCKPEPEGTLLSAVEFEEIQDIIVAFAVKFFDDSTGAPLPLQWIGENLPDEPKYLAGFKQAFQFQNVTEDRLVHDLTQSTFIRLNDNSVFLFDMIEVEDGKGGFASFSDVTVPLSTLMEQVVKEAYELLNYSSSDSTKKEKESDEGDCVFEEEEEVTKKESEEGKKFTEIELVIYQDDPNDQSGKQYADNKAKAANTEKFEAKGKTSILNKMKCLREECKCIKTLTIAAHGSSGSFRIGPKTTPYNSPTRVGGGSKQTSPKDFAKCIKPYLCDDASIHLLSCNTAAKDAGKDFIEDVADECMAKVTAYDETTFYRPSKKEHRTPGACWTANGDGKDAKVTKVAPAGFFE